MMQMFWSEMARRVSPYTPGEQPQDQMYVKLNTNECPYPPAPGLQDLDPDPDHLRLYPDPSAGELRSLIAARNGLDREEIFIGNGSDEVLAFSFMAFADDTRPVSFPDITYSFYPVYTQLFRIPSRQIPLRENFRLELSDYDEGSGPVVIANPNAPTGLALPRERLEQFLQAHPDRLLMVDEAYVDFGAESMTPLIHRYPNLLVIQTFSKSRAMAGARLGFAMGQSSLIQALERIKNSFNSYTISRYSLRAGAVSIQDEDYFQWTRRQIMKTRDALVPRLRSMGMEVTDSRTNFLWMRCPGLSGEALYEGLKRKGILVRHFSPEAIRDYIRVTIGTEEDMEKMMQALQEIRE